MTETSIDPLLEQLARRARESGVFGGVEVADGMLVCAAKASAEEAFYRVEPDGDTLWVALVMKDRWLSESIESQLVVSGDKLDELLEDELVDLGYEGPPMGFEHFRSEDMLFTFRSKVPGGRGGADAPRITGLCLLAYEQCFRELGDMEEGEDD